MRLHRLETTDLEAEADRVFCGDTRAGPHTTVIDRFLHLAEAERRGAETVLDTARRIIVVRTVEKSCGVPRVAAQRLGVKVMTFHACTTSTSSHEAVARQRTVMRGDRGKNLYGAGRRPPALAFAHARTGFSTGGIEEFVVVCPT